MILVKKIEELRFFLTQMREKGNTIGYVPTMGALHQGHISLITNSKSTNPITVSSIFINPTQFNDPKDFEKYPVTLEKDIAILEQAGCDILFLPSVAEMYPTALNNQQLYDLGYLETVLEGKYRPGHFQGVCQVVHRLLQIVEPDNLFLGQKDYQQCMVIKKLIELVKLKVNVIVCTTLREDDGLAMSSRNMRLNKQEREKAVKIYDTLAFLKREIKPSYVEDIKERALQYLAAEGFKPDYVAIASANNLELIEYWDGKENIVALIAAYLNEVRLIDNMLLN
ncbi:pantoate--beta-alanine ligase [Ferruginibacter sp.]|nr:pantoate--beta-alanine ligase [Ferruginibacter sp.]